ncbi:hypothetical protein KBB25_00930 [Candidatus Gracilibacteria bacterium]|nr:hypothetical protein [Candidatus Gracilibacteria bacterium]
MEILLRKNKEFFGWFQKYKKNIAIFFTIPLFSLLALSFLPIHIFGNFPDMYRADFWKNIFPGSYEKHHGYIFFLTLFGAFFLFSFAHSKKRLIQMSLIIASVISGLALLEFLGVFSFFQMNGVPSWGSGRTISTLGNPNYLAGYLLIHFPLVTFLRKPERYIVSILLLLALFTTKSIIGISLLGVYVFYISLGRFSYKNTLFLAFLLLLAFLAYFFLPSEKWLSLLSRFILMRETLFAIILHPSIFFFGALPDSLIAYFSLPRSDAIQSYFPVDAPIDSSHNLLIDILFQYGIFFLLFLGLLLWKSFVSQPLTIKYSLLLFLGFFSFNPYIIAPFLIFLLLLIPDSSGSKKISQITKLSL